ncbi:hypothetical protein EI42_06467 [Thermosporothrix hazakensis]|jgi:hypothetical protein|uniref:Uncharacterized protein n=1 Tax=Thermosporothrix hazakensis TaxID=644383 RepID=A0A326TKZ2_THEHA|nr:hypothetical protein EI42_06467 [Thermosporothrix hazakensis]
MEWHPQVDAAPLGRPLQALLGTQLLPMSEAPAATLITALQRNRVLCSFRWICFMGRRAWCGLMVCVQRERGAVLLCGERSVLVFALSSGENGGRVLALR